MASEALWCGVQHACPASQIAAFVDHSNQPWQRHGFPFSTVRERPAALNIYYAWLIRSLSVYNGHPMCVRVTTCVPYG